MYDVNDFILPATENSAVSITTRMTETEHILALCANFKRSNATKYYSLTNVTTLHNCHVGPRCIIPPFYREEYENQTLTRRVQLCWFRLSAAAERRNYQALDYTLFVKNFIEFPILNLVRNNLAPDMVEMKNYFATCEYDATEHPLCPRFRIWKILQMIEKEVDQYEKMFRYGSLIEIKISWNCNLDKPIKLCRPAYAFKRLDFRKYEQHPFDPGSNFMTSKHFFGPNDRQLHRLHTKIYNLHIVVSVTGEVGRFDLFQTTTSIGSFLGIFSAGTIVCDLIAAFFTNFKSVKYDS